MGWIQNRRTRRVHRAWRDHAAALYAHLAAGGTPPSWPCPTRPPSARSTSTPPQRSPLTTHPPRLARPRRRPLPPPRRGGTPPPLDVPDQAALTPGYLDTTATIAAFYGLDVAPPDPPAVPGPAAPRRRPGHRAVRPGPAPPPPEQARRCRRAAVARPRPRPGPGHRPGHLVPRPRHLAGLPPRRPDRLPARRPPAAPTGRRHRRPRVAAVGAPRADHPRGLDPRRPARLAAPTHTGLARRALAGRRPPPRRRPD